MSDPVEPTPEVTPEAVPSSGRHRSAKPGKAPKARKPPKVREAVADVPAAELAAPELTAPAPRQPSGLRPFIFPVTAVVTMAALIAAIILQFSSDSPKQLAPLNAQTKAAMAEANHTVKDILSYDYRQLDSNINTAKSEITGQLLSDYASTAKKVLASAVSVKAIVTATVSAQSVVQAQSDRVTLLLYVDQESVKQLAGAKTPTTRIDPFRVQMTMTKVKGHWVASDLKPV
jgi:Mce-associated membrane protein